MHMVLAIPNKMPYSLTSNRLLITIPFLANSSKYLTTSTINRTPLNRATRHVRAFSTTNKNTTSPDVGQQTTSTLLKKFVPTLKLMRLHKPTGTVLVLTPSLWSVSLLTPDISCIPDLRTCLIFTAGAVVARGLGCTLNDILDRNYDRHVARTRSRPIACGDISVKEAIFLLALQSVLGLYILCLNNVAVIKLGLFSGLMISTYPLFKRFTNWPQVMLALTINWGAIMGYAAINGSINISDILTLLPIYLGPVFWTLYYDTIYAHQDKTDDMFIGVKSSALVLGDKTKPFLLQMIGGMTGSLAMAGVLTGQVLPYYLSVATAGVFQLNQVRKLDLNNVDQCCDVFNQQKYIGILILAGILLSVKAKSSKRNLQKEEM